MDPVGQFWIKNDRLQRKSFIFLTDNGRNEDRLRTCCRTVFFTPLTSLLQGKHFSEKWATVGWEGLLKTEEHSPTKANRDVLLCANYWALNNIDVRRQKKTPQPSHVRWGLPLSSSLSHESSPVLLFDSAAHIKCLLRPAQPYIRIQIHYCVYMVTEYTAKYWEAHSGWLYTWIIYIHRHTLMQDKMNNEARLGIAGF